MIVSEAAILLASTAVYVGALLAFLGWLSRVDRSAWPFCIPVVAVVGVTAVLNPLDAIGVTITVGGQSVRILNIVDDVFAYTVVFLVVGLLAGASRRLLAAIAVTAFVARVSYEPANVGLVDGVAALVSVSMVFVGFFIILWLYAGPVWRAAQSVSTARRIVHWKARNLVVMIFVVLIATAVLSLVGAFQTFEQRLVLEHLNLVVRVGTAAFVFANVDALTDDGAMSEDAGSGAAGSSVADID